MLKTFYWKRQCTLKPLLSCCWLVQGSLLLSSRGNQLYTCQLGHRTSDFRSQEQMVRSPFAVEN